jgi:hypothetical protein
VFFLRKKIWIAWSKFRFLRLPVEKRVRLEVTQDGRHLTFLLVSLYEAGYGVQVVGSPAVFRELMLLRKSAPIPFVIGGKERSCGISITDKSGFNHRGHREHGGRKRVLLDYDFFSGLMERVEPQISRIYTDGKQGDAQGTCAGDAFSNPFTSELAWDAETTSPTRSANDPALVYRAGELGSDGGSQPADSVEFLEGQSQAGLQMDNQKSPTIRTANDLTAPGEYSSSMLIREIRGQNASSPTTSHSPLVTAPEALRAPYFMHPSVYYRGLHKRRSPDTALSTRHSPPVTSHSAEGGSPSHQSPATSYSLQRRRRFRIGFFGTHDRDFYTQHYHFPGMNRFEILEAFFEKFGSSFVNLEGAPREWNAALIAVAIDSQGGDRKGKTFLSQDHYFAALRECDFVLSPPGWCMPISHNLIEAMFCGAVPITNGGAFMAEPLSNGKTCLDFQDEEGLVPVIERALAMNPDEVSHMRQATRDYYARFLEPNAFGERLLRSESARVLVNAEENSVPLVFPGMVFPWDVPADTLQT